MGPAELAECFPVPGDRFRVVGQVSGAVIRGGRLPEIAPRQTGAGRYSPHRCPHKRTLIGTTGRWLAHDGQIKPERPMTSGNAPAADCSHNRGRRAATLMFACSRADERNPNSR